MTKIKVKHLMRSAEYVDKICMAGLEETDIRYHLPFQEYGQNLKITQKAVVFALLKFQGIEKKTDITFHVFSYHLSLLLLNIKMSCHCSRQKKL